MKTLLPDAGDIFAGPGPVVHPETNPFWESLLNGTMRLQQCEDCGTIRFPLAPVCFACLSFRHRWAEIGASGRVHAAVRVNRVTRSADWRGAAPFIAGVIDMGSGLRLPGRILCGCDRALLPGSPVTLCTIPATDGNRVWGFMHDCHDRS